MISISGKKWVEQKVDKNFVEKIKQDFNFSEILSRLIGVKKLDITEINNINNNLNVTNIFKNNSDFIKASDIVINSIKKNEKICILGDYDVDGATSTSLLVRYFKHIKQSYFYYIPDRQKDGYGATKKLFQKLILQEPKLVIMLDCGSTSNEAIDFLCQNKVKSIIIDHHEINKPYPNSDVIINPKKNNGYEEYDYLCAASLTFFFIDILIKKTNSDFKLSNFLIYVLLATVCDVMPLRKFNRLIAINVIKNFNIKDNLAFKFIFDYLDIKKKITIDDLGFLIGPIINSGGRLGYSTYGTELLTSDDSKIIKEKAIKLINLNNKRKELEKILLNEVDYEKIKKDDKNVIIYFKENLNEGLIGILAARLKDYFNKPAIVITKSHNILKASARSTKNFNIGKLIKTLYDKKIIENGGGHNMAAGFSMEKKNINLLDSYIQKYYTTKIKDREQIFKYDSEISSSAINLAFNNEVDKLGPFGNENFLPIFLIKNVQIIKSNKVNDIHVSAIIKPSKGSAIKSICYNCANTIIGAYLLSYKNKFNIIGQITENNWNNKKSIQLNIKDLVL